MKLAQRDEMKEKQRLKKEGIAMELNDDIDIDNGVQDEGEGEQDNSNELFGSDDHDVDMS